MERRQHYSSSYQRDRVTGQTRKTSSFSLKTRTMSPGGVQIIRIPLRLDHLAIRVRGQQNTRGSIAALTTPSPPWSRSRELCQEPPTVLQCSQYQEWGTEKPEKAWQVSRKSSKLLSFKQVVKTATREEPTPLNNISEGKLRRPQNYCSLTAKCQFLPTEVAIILTNII